MSVSMERTVTLSFVSKVAAYLIHARSRYAAEPDYCCGNTRLASTIVSAVGNPQRFLVLYYSFRFHVSDVSSALVARMHETSNLRLIKRTTAVGQRGDDCIEE